MTLPTVVRAECKDTHFEAIHNCLASIAPLSAVVRAECKDTHFEAIHNT